MRRMIKGEGRVMAGMAILKYFFTSKIFRATT
jgi:hypothetical protein